MDSAHPARASTRPMADIVRQWSESRCAFDRLVLEHTARVLARQPWRAV